MIVKLWIVAPGTIDFPCAKTMAHGSSRQATVVLLQINKLPQPKETRAADVPVNDEPDPACSTLFSPVNSVIVH